MHEEADASEMISFPQSFILLLPAVLAISCNRMPDSCQMRSYLMRPSGDQPHLQKRHTPVIAQGCITGFNGERPRHLIGIYFYFITFFAFMQISFDIFFLPLRCRTPDKGSPYESSGHEKVRIIPAALSGFFLPPPARWYSGPGDCILPV